MGIYRVPRVLNGVSAFAPYQVSLVDTTANNHFCGGAILNAFIILTAAHCLVRRDNRPDEDPTKIYYKKPHEMRVVAGQFNQQWPDPAAQQIRHVRRHKIHHMFSYSQGFHDIALLQLAAPLKIDKFVCPISLPIFGRLFKGNVTIYGWGISRVFQDTKVEETPNTLQMTEMSIISNAECRSTLIIPESVTEDMMCANSNGSTTCQGDSGSPVVCDDEYEVPPPPFTNNPAMFPRQLLCGIVSWSSNSETKCDVDDDSKLISPPPPTVFTKVSSYSAWISNVLHEKVVVKGYFLCDNLQYIPQVQQCDGNTDCLDGSDERNCSNNASSTGERPKDVTISSSTIQSTTEFYIKSTTENSTATDFDVDHVNWKWSMGYNSSIPTADLLMNRIM